MAGQFRQVDRTDGEIDALSMRLANVRTLAYVANRPDWLADPAHWQGVTRALEDRLSDTLHEKLMARFIDRRTSALMRGLGDARGAAGRRRRRRRGDGRGPLRRPPERPRLRGRARRHHAGGQGPARRRPAGGRRRRSRGGWAARRRAGRGLRADARRRWCCGAARRPARWPATARSPRACGCSASSAPAPARERAARRLEAFLAAEAGRRLPSLRRLEEAVASGALKGLPRGLAYRLIEAGGVLARTGLEAELRSLSQGERRALRASACASAPSRCSCRSWPAPARGVRAAPSRWPPRRTGGRPTASLVALPTPAPPRRGRWRCAALSPSAASPCRSSSWNGWTSCCARAARQGGGVLFSDQAREELGWSEAEAAAGAARPGLRAGRPRRRRQVWRRRAEPKRRREQPGAVAPRSPFAALAALKPPLRRTAAPPPPPPPQRRVAMAEDAVPRRRLALARALLQDPLAGRPPGRGGPRAPDPRRPARRALDKAARTVKAGRRAGLRHRRAAARGEDRGAGRAPRPAGRGAGALFAAGGKLTGRVERRRH